MKREDSIPALDDSEKDALMLVLYSMIYIPTDVLLKSPALFNEDFCRAFKKQFAKRYHPAIKKALAKVSASTTYPFEELLPILKEKYSADEIHYYLNEFGIRVMMCE